jgi:hypothetical protein
MLLNQEIKKMYRIFIFYCQGRVNIFSIFVEFAYSILRYFFLEFDHK